MIKKVMIFYNVAAALSLCGALVFSIWPQKDLFFFLTNIALMVSREKVAYVGMPRLETELIFLISKLRFFLPLVAIAFVAWGILWSSINRLKDREKNISVPGKPASISRLVLFLLIFLAFVTRIWQLRQSLFFDEVYAATHCISAASFLKSLSSNLNAAYHIFYSLVVRWLFLIFGDHLWVYRGPALVFGILGVLAIIKLSGLLKDKSIVLVSALLLIFSPIHIDHSQLARGYGAFVLFSIASCYFMIRAIREEKAFLWIGFMMSIILGFYTHLYMAMVFLGQFVAVLAGVFVLKADKKTEAPIISFTSLNKFFFYSSCAFFILFLLYLPFLPVIVFDCLRNYQHEPLNQGFLISLVKALGPGENGIDLGIIQCVLAIIGLFFLWRKDRFFSVLGLALFIVPVVIVILLKPMYLFTRYFVFLLPFYLIFMAAGICWLAQKILPRYQNFVAAVFLISIFALNFPGLYFDANFARQPYDKAALFIEKTFPKNTAVVAPGFAGGEVSYYLKNRPILTAANMAETLKSLKDHPDAIFFVTYKPTIEPKVMAFIKENYRCLVFYPGRVSSVYVYGKKDE